MFGQRAKRASDELAMLQKQQQVNELSAKLLDLAKDNAPKHADEPFVLPVFRFFVFVGLFAVCAACFGASFFYLRSGLEAESLDRVVTGVLACGVSSLLAMGVAYYGGRRQ